MQLIELKEQDKLKYNSFVASHPSGSFLQSWEWGGWQENLGREVYRFFLMDSDSVAGSMQLIRMPVLGKRFYLYAPYGPVLAKGENFKFQISNFQGIFNDLKSRFPEALFIRIEPKDQQLPATCYQLLAKSTHIQPVNTLVLDLSKSIDQLLKEMHPKTRYNIRLAQKHGVEIVSDLAIVPGHGLYLEEVLGLIMETAKRQNFKTFTEDYYRGLLDFFGAQNHCGDLKIYIYKALYGRELLAAAVMVDFGKVRTYLFGGSAAAHRDVMAPHLLHFKAISDAQALGLRSYDFWGLDTVKEKNPGFARFKLGFGGKRLEYPGAYDLVFAKGQYRFYQVLRWLNRLRF